MLRELCQHIQNRDSYNIIGTNLLCGFRPMSAQDNCVTLLERSGDLPSFYIDGKFEKPVQILARSNSYESARQYAAQVVSMLCGMSGAGMVLPCLTSGSVYRLNAAEVVSGPSWLGQDDAGRHEFTANILLHMQLN